MSAAKTPLSFVRPSPPKPGSEYCDLLFNTPPEQREFMLESLRITLDNAHTLYTRSDYDDPAECIARLRFLSAVAHTLVQCRQEWG